MRGRSVWGGRGECWSIWASVFLAPWMEYDLISGQAVPRRPQWGNGVGVEAQNWSFMWWYQPLKRNGTNMADRNAFFPCRTLMLCSSIWDTLPWWRSNLFPFDLLLLHYKKLSKPPPPLHYNAGIIFMNERVRWSVISLHPQPRTLNEFINEKSGERNLQDMKNRMHSTRRAEWLESVNWWGHEAGNGSLLWIFAWSIYRYMERGDQRGRAIMKYNINNSIKD